MADVSTWSTTAASNNSASPDGAPEGMAPSGVNDTIRENMAALAKWYSDTDGTLITAGSSNAYTLATNCTHPALADMPLVVFRADRANTGAATLNVDGLGAKAMRFAGAALVANAILADTIVLAAYNATDDIYDLANAGAVNVSSAGTVKLSDGSVLLTSASRAYTPTTGAQNLFDFTLAVANCAFKVTAIFEDVNFANGSIIWELYIGVLGSGTTLSSATITQEDKHRIASGSLTSYGTWAVSVASNKLRLTHTGTVASGIGTLSLSVVSTTVTAPVADV